MAISKFKTETLRTVAFGSIGAAYSIIGSAFSYPISKLYIVNDTDVGVYISDDGTNNKFYIPDGRELLIDITIENQNPDYLPKGSAFYVKQGPEGAASSGILALSAMYGDKR